MSWLERDERGERISGRMGEERLTKEEGRGKKGAARGEEEKGDLGRTERVKGQKLLVLVVNLIDNVGKWGLKRKPHEQFNLFLLKTFQSKYT